MLRSVFLKDKSGSNVQCGLGEFIGQDICLKGYCSNLARDAKDWATMKCSSCFDIVQLFSSLTSGQGLPIRKFSGLYIFISEKKMKLAYLT